MVKDNTKIQMITSLDEDFLPAPAAEALPVEPLDQIARFSMEELEAMARLPFNDMYDRLRARVREADVDDESRHRAAMALEEINCKIVVAHGDDLVDAPRELADLHAALLQLMTALYIKSDRIDLARRAAARALTILSRTHKRRDEPFLLILAAILLDVAELHANSRQYKQAEREIEKSIKLLGRLASADPDRYAPAHALVTSAATAVYRNRVRQADMLAAYHETTQNYLSEVNNGVDSAFDRLIEALFTEGKALAEMGRHREAITYFTRALKYHKRLHATVDMTQLAMSIELGKSLLQAKSTRDKGIHLLNTLLHIATRLKAAAEHRDIVNILAATGSRQLDILDIWYKVFPR